MALILCIETATPVCSVGLFRDGHTIALLQSSGTNDHAAMLAGMINEIFRMEGLQLQQADAIAVSKGPGSYTGLRIGVSTAKGLCYSTGKPLIAVHTLEAMALGMIKSIGSNAEMPQDLLFCPMIDARRMEVYCAVYDRKLTEIMPVSPLIVTGNSFENFLARKAMLCFGDGADKSASLLEGRKRLFLKTGFTPSAGWMGFLAEQKLRDGLIENTAYFEPFYLKEFVAGKPVVKGLY
ncbi:MAG TPA: tRNA (adenosine(37)-N6)-threonylcarbamoyltransferase complex dimerization subunit type 1 TsaB [Bacteroidales bacterium]|nr:tRNA (adenosine(37)-N6)-threonylcarbamoyltransferase complex dimerization subunit type 1 TsaB [Bacteroidales bacterium]HSA43900.1 tRNA (adenosine(37)-N6)-threonylcarbamoyltransferase complex dimerization subunit type 1 TsaB [Bacteroidales bacterium]